MMKDNTNNQEKSKEGLEKDIRASDKTGSTVDTNNKTKKGEPKTGRKLAAFRQKQISGNPDYILRIICDPEWG